MRDLYNITAAARGHWVIYGTPQRIADIFEEWFTGGMADGFVIMPAYFPGAFDDFVDKRGAGAAAARPVPARNMPARRCAIISALARPSLRSAARRQIGLSRAPHQRLDHIQPSPFEHSPHVDDRLARKVELPIGEMRRAQDKQIAARDHLVEGQQIRDRWSRTDRW